MAMFTAYFDASGSSASHPYVVVSGYIANYLQWKMFETSWQEVHEQHGVKLPLHMSELVAALIRPEDYKKQNNARADYVSLAADPKRANDFFKFLCITQCGLINCAISCIVPISLYNQVNPELAKIIPPYAYGARTCLARIHQWEKEFDIQEPVECIFEYGDFGQGRFTELMVEEGAEPPIYKKKKEYAGLQAADHYAWEQFNFLRLELQNAHLPARGAFQLQLNAIPKMHVEPSLETLINLCHWRGIDPNTGVQNEKSKRVQELRPNNEETAGNSARGDQGQAGRGEEGQKEQKEAKA